MKTGTFSKCQQHSKHAGYSMSISSWNSQRTTLRRGIIIAVSRSPGRSSRFEVYGSDLVSSGTPPSDKSTDRQRTCLQSVGWLFDDNFKLLMISGSID